MQPVIAADPDDDAVIACAVAARADYIVSGDSDMRNLKRHAGISIVNARELVALLTPQAMERLPAYALRHHDPRLPQRVSPSSSAFQ